MKLISNIIITSSIIMLSTVSCKKDNPSNGVSSPPSAPPPPTLSLSLVANHWIRNGLGIYVDYFTNIIPTANVNGKSNVKIFLVENQQDIQINNSIHFMGNDLWATNSQSDVSINYRCDSTGLPFAYLEIKVVVE
jgi:hypothetical protein